MRVRLIAAGTRLPQWINEGVAEYAKRLGHGLRFELIEIPTARLAERMARAIAPRDYVVALEISGRAMSTAELAQWLGAVFNSASTGFTEHWTPVEEPVPEATWQYTAPE
jgi:23S rRNA (pseudouridine1915-N3)-methyltransferase